MPRDQDEAEEEEAAAGLGGVAGGEGMHVPAAEAAEDEGEELLNLLARGSDPLPN